MNEETMKTVGILAVIVLVAGGLAFVANGRLQVIGTPADTDTSRVDRCDLHIGLKGAGAFADPETDARKFGEVSPLDVVYYGWFQGSKSQLIVGEGKVERCGIQPSIWPTQARYRFSILDDGWRPFYTEATPNAFLDTALGGGAFQSHALLGAFAFEIEGFTYCVRPVVSPCAGGDTREIKDGAVLRVDVYARSEHTVVFEAFTRFARDEVALRSAIASVSWDKDGYVLGVDRVATFRWRAPTATYRDCANGVCQERPAYFYEVINRNTNEPIPGFERKPIPSASGRLTVDLTDDMFSNVLGVCDNHLEVVLFTEIAGIDHDFTAIAKLGAGERPVVTSVTLSDPDIREGDVVTVQWASRGNVTEYIVRVFIGGREILDTRLPAGRTSLTFSATVVGEGSVFVTALSFCQPSDVFEVPFVVENVHSGICQKFPKLTQCAAGNAFGWVFLILSLLAVLAAFILVMWIFGKLGIELPGTVRLLIAFLAAAGVAYLALNAGAFDVALGV